jgi:acyl-CoA synthetase (AMP-forming)/AMP-acid ligase II
MIHTAIQRHNRPSDQPLDRPVRRHYSTMAEAILAAIDEEQTDLALGHVRRMWVYAEDGTRQSLTYRELASEGLRWAQWYRWAGVAQGEVVFIGLPMGVDYIGALLGCILLGALPCTVPFGTDVEASAGALNNTVAAYRRIGPRFLITTPSAVAQLREKALIPESVPVHVSATERRRELPRALLPDILPTDIHHIQLTSGSTGTPKGAVLTHQAVTTNIDSVVDAMQGNVRTDAGACWLPMYHDMGLMQLLMVVYQRAEMVLQSSSSFLRNPMRWLERIHEHRVTMAAAPAFAFTYCARRYRSDVASKLDLSCWRIAGVGAERVEHRVLRDFHARFSPHGFPADSFRNCYGMAEAGFAVSMPARPWAVHDDSEPVPSVGRPVAGMDIQVRGPDGRELADGKEGELFMRGSSLMSGYFGDDLATANQFEGEWFRTGDLGYSRNGELFILGRLKELVILGGRNYHPQVFEQCIAGDPDVGMHRSVALGVYRELSGTESLVLLIEPRIVRGLAALRARLQARLRAQFGFGASEIVFLQSGGIPRTTSHKAQRDASRQLYETGHLQALIEREPISSTMDNVGT